ncbi:MAG: response regulator [Pseudomarimonas sp.]
MSSVLQQTLHDRALDWAKRFCARVQSDWQPSEVQRLHQQLDGLAIEADARGEEMLLEATLELSTALCAFLGHGPEPSRAQLGELLELTDAMLFASVDENLPEDAEDIIAVEARSEFAKQTAAAGAAPAEVIRHDVQAVAATTATVWCISANPRLIERLRGALASLGMELATLLPSLGWTDALPEHGVTCVVVDGESLGVLLDLQRRSSGASSHTHACRPTYIAVLGDASTEERVRALRAGADHVLRGGESPEHLAERLAHILAARSEEALSVVVIDDDPSQTLFCSSILRRVGVSAICCNDAKSAMRAFRQELPDVVLVDLHMPETDGLELTEQLLALPGSEFVSILFLSGDDEPDTRFDALTAGADDYLSKPIQPRHLIRAVLAHGKRSQRRRRAATRLATPIS